MKSTEAERLVQCYRELQGYTIHRAVNNPIWSGGRVVGSHSNDVWGVADVLSTSHEGIRIDQVTTGESTHVSRRKKKLEAIPWPLKILGTKVFEVAVIRVRQRSNPKHKGWFIYSFRIARLGYSPAHGLTWGVEEFDVPAGVMAKFRGKG